jgi:hypothetical protein
MESEILSFSWVAEGLHSENVTRAPPYGSIALSLPSSAPSPAHSLAPQVGRPSNNILGRVLIPTDPESNGIPINILDEYLLQEETADIQYLVVAKCIVIAITYFIVHVSTSENNP